MKKKRKQRGKVNERFTLGEFNEWHGGDSRFGTSPIDLSGKALTAHEKQWLGEQLYHEVMSAGEMAIRFNLEASTLGYYKQVIRNSLDPSKSHHKQFRDDSRTVATVQAEVPEPTWWSEDKELEKGRLEDADKLFIIQMIDSKKISVGTPISLYVTLYPSISLFLFLGDFAKKYAVPHSTVSGFRSQLKKKGLLVDMETEKPVYQSSFLQSNYHPMQTIVEPAEAVAEEEQEHQRQEHQRQEHQQQEHQQQEHQQEQHQQQEQEQEQHQQQEQEQEQPEVREGEGSPVGI